MAKNADCQKCYEKPDQNYPNLSFLLCWSNEVEDRVLKNKEKSERNRKLCTPYSFHCPSLTDFSLRIVVTRTLARRCLTHELSLHLDDTIIKDWKMEIKKFFVQNEAPVHDVFASVPKRIRSLEGTHCKARLRSSLSWPGLKVEKVELKIKKELCSWKTSPKCSHSTTIITWVFDQIVSENWFYMHIVRILQIISQLIQRNLQNLKNSKILYSTCFTRLWSRKSPNLPRFLAIILDFLMNFQNLQLIINNVPLSSNFTISSPRWNWFSDSALNEFKFNFDHWLIAARTSCTSFRTNSTRIATSTVSDSRNRSIWKGFVFFFLQKLK